MPSDLESNLGKLSQEFIQGLPDQVGGIESAWVSIWRKGWNPEDVHTLRIRLHTLAGSAGALGFEQIANSASAFESLLQSKYREDENQSGEMLSTLAESNMVGLRKAIYTDQQIDVQLLTRRMGLSKASSSSLQEKRADRLIFLVDDDAIQAEELAEQVGYFGYAVQIFNETSSLEDALQTSTPTVILMDVTFPEGSEWGFETIASLRSKFSELPPVIFLTVNDQAFFRLQAVRVGGEAYFPKPVDVNALIDVLDRLILPSVVPTYRVLIVDDSRVQANYIAMQLKNAGIATEIVSDPLTVIEAMIVFNPDLLLLDMYMPDCTGMELAKVIRQMEQFISVPIVFLSAEMDKGKQMAALGIGGDDFLTKPIEPEYLISAVTTRIGRYRKMRALMIQDSLTGLLNHSTTRERLVQEVERARRHHLNLSYAMIDLDHFKTVNDSYGHSTGDRVLKSLAHLLKQRLRSSDTIGRIGGEEFAIILADTDEVSTVKVMTDLCESFARVHHYAGEKEFSVTLSCGVASFPGRSSADGSAYSSADGLTAAADEAMYAAKAAGRGRVLSASEMKGRGEFPTRSSKLLPRTNGKSVVGHQDGFNGVGAATETATYLAALNRISQVVMNWQDLPSIVVEFTREVRNLFNAQHVGLSLLTQDQAALEFIGNSQAGWNEQPGQANRVFLPDDPASKQVIETGKAVLVTNAMNNPLSKGSQPLLRKHRIQTRIVAPLLSRGKTIGTLNIDYEKDNQAVSAIDLELSGTIAGIIASVIENTRLLSVEQQQKEYYEALVRNIPTAVVTIDLQARIISWNPAAEDLFGYSSTEAIGQNIDDLLASDEYRQEALQYTQKTLKSNEFLHTFTLRRRKDGALANVELLAVPVIVNEVHQANLAIYHNITELERARREAEAANHAKSAFLATMSHEIRTPLNAIIGMTTLLLDSPMTEEQEDYANTIRNSGDALLSIINDILDFSKIEAGKMELEEQAFDLRECIESALDLVTTTANQKGIDLAYILEPTTPAVIISDSTRLRQILLNLLSNALKFTSSGEVVVSISGEKTTESGSKAYSLHFAVRDSGIGIPAEKIDRLFRSFSQLDASTTRKYGGTGLGLAISKRLSELMGGNMWVESEGIAGKGSTFHFTIQADMSSSSLPKFMNVRQPELIGKRVLVVDDNATNRYLLVRQVQSWGMKAQETGNPLQALQWIREGQLFDLALLDMQMPEMDGNTLAVEITHSYQGEVELPLIMLTSLGLRDFGPKAPKFAAYLTKPIKPALLYSKVLEVFGGRPGSARPQADETLPPASQTGKHEPLRLLLAEDMVVNQKVALLLLERIGYKADVVGNGYEVLDALRRQPYDVILMDIQMPDMDGLEATRRVRSGEWLKAHEDDTFERQPFIIAMTANAMQGDRENYLTAGMDDYISKPVRVDELSRALKAAYEAQHARLPAVKEEIRGSAGDALDQSEYERFLRSIGVENGEAITSLIQDYLDESARLVEQFRQAATAGDMRKTRASMHSLKSSSKLFGAMRLADLCQTLEIAAQTADQTAVQTAVQTNPDHFDAQVISGVEHEYGQAIAALKIKLSEFQR